MACLGGEREREREEGDMQCSCGQQLYDGHDPPHSLWSGNPKDAKPSGHYWAQGPR